MKNALALLAVLAGSALAQQSPAESRSVKDKALAKIVHHISLICPPAARRRAEFDKKYAGLQAPDADLGVLEAMVSELKALKAAEASCKANEDAMRARVDSLLGAGTGARVKSASAFEGVVRLSLEPLPTKEELERKAKEEAETWKRIEEGWKNGAGCP